MLRVDTLAVCVDLKSFWQAHRGPHIRKPGLRRQVRRIWSSAQA